MPQVEIMTIRAIKCMGHKVILANMRSMDVGVFLLETVKEGVG